jgi:transcriptional/translational regulatory protein YebC/TACO1
MSEHNELVNSHVETILATAKEQNIPTDLIGRALVNAGIAIWQESRSIGDIAQELSFLADNLDPDEEYTFMRP